MIICSSMKIIVPIVAVIALLLIIAICFVLFRRKKATKEHLNSTDLIARNSNLVDTVIELTDNDEDKKILRDVKEKLKYLIPSEKKEVYESDEEISNLLREFRIKLTAVPNDSDIIENYTRKINVAIAARNALL